MLRQAVVLVGGKGTRLGDFTRNIPKPLLPIRDDKRFLDYLLERIASSGFTDIILVAGHLGHMVQERYDGNQIGNSNLRVIVEREPAGTGGALSYVADMLDHNFMMLNGDSYFDFAFQALGSVLTENAVGAIALRVVSDVSRYGTVQYLGDRVLRFTEKDAAQRGSGVISGGVYFLHKSILKFINSNPCSLETEVFPKLAEEGRLKCRLFGGYFIDIGLPDSLHRARQELPGLFDYKL